MSNNPLLVDHSLNLLIKEGYELMQTKNDIHKFQRKNEDGSLSNLLLYKSLFDNDYKLDISFIGNDFKIHRALESIFNFKPIIGGNKLQEVFNQTKFNQDTDILKENLTSLFEVIFEFINVNFTSQDIFINSLVKRNLPLHCITKKILNLKLISFDQYYKIASTNQPKEGEIEFYPDRFIDSDIELRVDCINYGLKIVSELHPNSKNGINKAKNKIEKELNYFMESENSVYRSDIRVYENTKP